MMEIVNIIKLVFDWIFIRTPLGLTLVAAIAITELRKK
jgi:uncharacterized phage-like protein YoqJ